MRAALVDTRAKRLPGAVGTIAALLVLAVLLAGLVALAGCSNDESEITPEQAIDSLLELRMERSTDASAYAEFIADPDLATQLAQASVDETGPPTPAWEDPYVSTTATSTADVVVVWIPDDDHPDWPIATVFTVQSIDGSWKAVDAVPVEEGAAPPEPE